MSSIHDTARAIYESFKNPGVKLGYVGIGICVGASATLPYLRAEANFIALCTGVGALGILANTLRIQYQLVKRAINKY